MITIINYGIGNIGSVFRMIEKVGGSACIAHFPDQIANASKIILPGVGSFDRGILNLQPWIDALSERVISKKIPILGICLGMQLMCNKSDEGVLQGLGWIDAEVKHINHQYRPTLKVPHMGWNRINVTKLNPLIFEKQKERFYFVHSYHVVCNNKNDIIASTQYGDYITAAFQKENIFGVQFHPEKSHRFGMSLLKNFMEL